MQNLKPSQISTIRCVFERDTQVIHRHTEFVWYWSRQGTFHGGRKHCLPRTQHSVCLKTEIEMINAWGWFHVNKHAIQEKNKSPFIRINRLRPTAYTFCQRLPLNSPSFISHILISYQILFSAWKRWMTTPLVIMSTILFCFVFSNFFNTLTTHTWPDLHCHFRTCPWKRKPGNSFKNCLHQSF